MLELTIGNKNYKIEYTIEASLHDECIEKVTSLMINLSSTEDAKDVKEVISSISDVPKTTLTMFYAGLLEHHGEDGDGSVLSEKDAKKLIKQYFAENKENGTDNFYDLMGILVEQMGNDGFFKQIGLQQAVQQTKEQKRQQDRKRKQTTVTSLGEK